MTDRPGHRPEDAADERPDREPARDERTGRAAAAQRMQHQSQWVDLQIKQAMERGEFDDLPGTGKPIEGLGATHDPDWWIKGLIEREQVTGVLPPALQLRKDDAELDARLDRLAVESEVRAEVEEFNARVLRARYTPVDGPPLVTQPRDVDATVAAWRARRVAAARAARAAAADVRRAPAAPHRTTRRRRWWQPGSGRGMRHTDG
jgi:hypothetical protein